MKAMCRILEQEGGTFSMSDARFRLDYAYRKRG